MGKSKVKTQSKEWELQWLAQESQTHCEPDTAENAKFIISLNDYSNPVSMHLQLIHENYVAQKDWTIPPPR